MPPTSIISSSAEESERQEKIEHRIKNVMLMHFLIIVEIIGLGFGLHYQYKGQEKSLFEEHEHHTIALSVFGSLYALVLWAEFKLSWRISDFKLRFINRFSPLFGTLVVGQLMIMLFPLSGLAFIICWTIWMLNAIIKTVKETLQWLPQVILCYFGYGGGGSSTMIEENESPGGGGNESPV